MVVLQSLGDPGRSSVLSDRGERRLCTVPRPAASSTSLEPPPSCAALIVGNVMFSTPYRQRRPVALKKNAEIAPAPGKLGVCSRHGRGGPRVSRRSRHPFRPVVAIGVAHPDGHNPLGSDRRQSALIPTTCRSHHDTWCRGWTCPRRCLLAPSRAGVLDGTCSNARRGAAAIQPAASSSSRREDLHCDTGRPRGEMTSERAIAAASLAGSTAASGWGGVLLPRCTASRRPSTRASRRSSRACATPAPTSPRRRSTPTPS